MAATQAEKAVYLYGSQLNIPYVPNADLAAGDVVDLGTFVGVALEPIKTNGDPGGSLCLTGVFSFLKETGTALNVGDMILWDAGQNLAYKTSGYTESAAIGPCVAAAASGDLTVAVLMNPYHVAVTG